MSRYTTEECHLVVRQALDELIERDAFLISEMANERALTHRLGMYLQERIPDMNVDCEYNRMGTDGDKKKSDNDHRIIPDIIVHNRGKSEDDSDLIAIEAKKNADENGKCFDLEKLKGMTDRDGGYRYQVGYFIDFVAGSLESRQYRQTDPSPIKDLDRVYEIRVEGYR